MFREYDPLIGRWWSADPKRSLTPGESPYAYCANNPINLVDPDGDKAKVDVVYDPQNNNREINVSEKIYITGAYASNNLADRINKEVNEMYKKQNLSYTDPDGNVWKVNLSVQYEYRKDVKKLKLGKDENLMTIISKF